MKVAEAISHCLVAEGITLAAGLSGQSIGPLLDQIASRTEIELMYARQERGAFDICDGYARACGKPAVVFTDAGPAAANLMGGLVNSWGDSIPVLFFAGHNDRVEIASGQTKEIPFVEIFGPVSKWATVINDPAQALGTIRRAFMHMRTGRPGPVVVGVPVDVANMEIGEFDYTPVSSQPRARSGGDPVTIDQAVDMIASAKKPYVYAGAGVLFSQATDELVELAELLTLPVATTLNGKSAFPETHPLSLGIGGFARASYSSMPATKIGEAADVIFTIGCGFKQHATQKLPGVGVRHIQIDIDPKELNRDHVADIAILGDARIVLTQLVNSARARLDQSRLAPIASQVAAISSMQAQWQKLSEPLLTSVETPINPFRVTAELMKLVDPVNTILLHDAGTVRGTTSQHYVAPVPGSFIGFGVQSAMGWTIGASMGAKKANPEKLVIGVIGEEAFNETAMDIETSVRNDAPVLIIIKNNRRYADHDGGKSQRLAQARFHQGTNNCALAAALGANAIQITDPEKLASGLSDAIQQVKAGKTTIVEILTTRVVASLHRLWDKA